MKSILTTSLALAALSLLVTGCQTNTIATIGKPICLIWQPIDYSASKDTAETIDAARVNNAKRDEYCK